MDLHDSIRITNWFYILYIENNGMAYGMSFIPKICLTSFRFVACIFLAWYIYKEVMRGARWVWTLLLTFILAGAVGNLIDCLFYGVWFGDAPFMEGRVVDMFYFPLIVTQYPDWFPFWAGEPYIFFAPVFNFADSCISVAVVLLLLSCRKELKLVKDIEPDCSKSDTLNIVEEE